LKNELNRLQFPRSRRRSVLAAIFLTARSGDQGYHSQVDCAGIPAERVCVCGVEMTISQEQKLKIMEEHAKTPGDTGSPEVQIAVLTAEIQVITEHLQTHSKDYSSRRGLLAKVSRRRQFLDYLKRDDLNRYVAIITRLNIRK
jgi:small subunit ribosomal protein S15